MRARAPRLRLAAATALSILVPMLTVSWAFPAAADAGADLLGRAVVADPATFRAAELVVSPPTGGTVLVDSAPVAGFPTSGSDYVVLSTGDAAGLHGPNNSGSTGSAKGGSARGAFDVTVLRLDLQVPADSNCLLGLDFRFLSEEYPEYVGSSFNDAFIAELDDSTWAVSGSSINAPKNFAFDTVGNPISINAAGATSMKPEYAAGTTFDGATPLLSAATPITPGAHSIYLSIFDAGDQAYDSAVTVDNLRFGHVADVSRDCHPGADLAAGRHVALGDSYSSGFGNAPYDFGTNVDNGPNDCQRSPQAWGPLVSKQVDLKLDFHACQGAVTADFYHARSDREDEDWGEKPQLDHLGPDAALVTLTIGGNDAQFGDIYSECVLGFELLPWNTCSGDDKVTKPLQASLDRLNGGSAGDDERLKEITPYGTLYSDVRVKTPYATRVAMGYPTFFPKDGADTTFRCEGIKRVDQRWMHEQTLAINAMIKDNAERNGFRVADPVSRFEGHEFCGSSGDSWFYGLSQPGKVHPTVVGQQNMADAAVQALEQDNRPHFLVRPQQTATTTVNVTTLLDLLSLFLEWPGSDIPLTVVSPSGKEYSRTAHIGATQDSGPTWDHIEIPHPEVGAWTVKMYGADVAPTGETAVLTVAQIQPSNQAPVPAMTVTQDGSTLVMDSAGSTDPDGRVVSYDWYVDLSDAERVASGAIATVQVPTGRPLAVTLAVKDDGGRTTFRTQNFAPLEVSPNSVNTKSNGVTPMTLLSRDGFDAAVIRAETLRVGPAGARAQPPLVHVDDIDGDGRADLKIQVDTQAMGLKPGDTSLCLTGQLPDGHRFTACDGARIK